VTARAGLGERGDEVRRVAIGVKAGHSWLMVICLLLLTVGGGPFVARGGGEKMLISYNSAVFDVVPVTVAYQQVSPPPVGRSAM